MKKIIFITLLLIICTLSIYSLDVINFNMQVEFGVIPGGTFKTYSFTRRVYKPLPLFGDFRFNVNMFDEHLYFGIGSKIIIWKVIDSKVFKPDSVNFLFFAGIMINDNVELFWRHYCDHPVKSWDNGSNTDLERWYEEAGIKITFNLFKED